MDASAEEEAIFAVVIWYGGDSDLEFKGFWGLGCRVCSRLALWPFFTLEQKILSDQKRDYLV